MSSSRYGMTGAKRSWSSLTGGPVREQLVGQEKLLEKRERKRWEMKGK